MYCLFFIRVELVVDWKISGVHWTNYRIIFLDDTKFVEKSWTFLCQVFIYVDICWIKIYASWVGWFKREPCRIEDFIFVDASTTFRCLYPEWPHRQGGCLTCCGCTFESSWVHWFILFTRRSGGTAHEGGGATSQLDLPSLTPLSVAGCGWLRLRVPHWAASVYSK